MTDLVKRDTTADLELAALEDIQALWHDRDGKLGAHVGGGDPRFPMVRDYAKTDIAVPVACHRSLRGFEYGMLGNDRYGDCVIAEIYHAIQHARQVLKRADVPPGDEALTACALGTYGAVTGFREDDPSTDQGTDPVAAWAYWQQTGVPLPDGSTDKIAGTAQILPHDGANVRRGIYEFDCVGIALSMPVAWQGARTWEVGGDFNSDPRWQPGGWGGHMVGGVSFDRRYIAVVTWGGIKLCTWQALGTYGQLVLARVSADQADAGGRSETGLDMDALARDLPVL